MSAFGQRWARAGRRWMATHAGGSKLRMILLGAPGSGKGTQSERLLKKFDIKSVVVGDLLRQEIRAGSSLGQQADAVMKAGGLLPDKVVLELVQPALAALKDEHWVLDGFPRKASQAVLLDDLLANQGDELNFVASLVVPDEVILERIEQRWIHAPSGRVYNLSYNPPQRAGLDDVTGEALSQRPDDTAEVFSKRLAAFHAENEPLLSHYASAHVTASDGTQVPKLVSLTGRTSNEITPKLEKALSDRFPALPTRASR